MDTPIVFIHGTNAGPWAMENFHQHFAKKGFHCHSPSYRHHENLNSEQSKQRLKGVSIADYISDITAFVQALHQKPILVGHSLGGIIAQKLATMGLARAIVLLNGSINWGILPTTEEERALGKLFMTAGKFWEDVLLPDFETMAKFGLNKLNIDEQHKVFYRLGPESGRVLFELFFWIFDNNKTTKIDYKNISCPILMVSGSDDLAAPPSTARLIANKHLDKKTTFYIAENFGHYLILEPEWPRIAEFCSNWVIQQLEK
ncbi:alpha/beta hydrolase [Microbulbifer sp. OS29]|uniref:Alpha/beta hydrolase n=1 Tax=Microbulbifer okhotskensis TaxID=2926617 RepID=A0A9X2EPY6_9GAMM|nr:alpha/beta hydrolase [Microbulbifer okhotskensis]MCO1335664.1 alpha/beta hydrolase [Microbulbifer okhotskensis]